jgi:hypothetical protein
MASLKEIQALTKEIVTLSGSVAATQLEVDLKVKAGHVICLSQVKLILGKSRFSWSQLRPELRPQVNWSWLHNKPNHASFTVQWAVSLNINLPLSAMTSSVSLPQV